MTDSFSYRSGALCAEQVPLERIAKDVGTPFYCYSTAQLQKNYKDFANSFGGLKTAVFYAIKASPNLALVRTLAQCGAGVDITLIGEMERAISAGVPPHKIIYSGVGKERNDIATALRAGIYQINLESMPEMSLVNEVAAEMGIQAPVAVRVNPDVDARTYKQNSTGELGTKFGIDYVQIDEAMKRVAELSHLDFKGFQVHIGSHVHNYEPFREAFLKLADLVRLWRSRGVNISRLDLSGGVGIPYDGQTLPPFSDYAAIVKETTGSLGCEILFEPGRRLVGDAGILVSRVVYDKQGASKRFLILDAGMNDLIRPAMYGARHSILPVRESAEKNTPAADVVGPVCETSDLFGADYHLPGVGEGDLVAILQAGAYGAAMSSNYNGRPLIPEVLVSGSQFAVVRRRIAIAEQMSWEALPPWMESEGRKQGSGTR